MRRTIFAAALALGFAATAAYAQADNPPSPPKPPADNGPAATPPPNPDRPGDEVMRGHEGMGKPDEMRGPGRHGPWMKHHMMMMSKGAHIRVSDGDVHVNVKCAEDDSTAECGQTVIKIIREMQSSGQSSGYEDQNDEDSGHGGNGDESNPTMNE